MFFPGVNLAAGIWDVTLKMVMTDQHFLCEILGKANSADVVK